MDSSVPRKRGPEHRILDPDDHLFLLALEGEREEEGRGPLVTCYEKAELRLKRSAF